MRLVSGESFGTVVLYVGVGTRYTVFKYQHAEWDFFIGAFIEWEAFFSALLNFLLRSLAFLKTLESWRIKPLCTESA